MMADHRRVKNRLDRLNTSGRTQQQATPLLTSTPESESEQPRRRLIERLGLLKKCSPTEVTKPAAKQAARAEPDDPTANYFRNLAAGPVRVAPSPIKNSARAGDKRRRDDDYDDEDASVGLIERLTAGYSEKGYEILSSTNTKLDAARADIEAKVASMATEHREFTAEMAEGQKWSKYTLSDRKFQTSQAGTPVSGTIGDAASGLRNRMNGTQKEVSALWAEWEGLDGQVSSLRKELVAGYEQDGDDGPGGTSDQVSGQIREVIAAADAELEKLADEAVEEVKRAEKAMHEQMEKEKARILGEARKAMDMYF